MLPITLDARTAAAARPTPLTAGVTPAVLVPPWIAGQHFVAALGFYAAGALGLVLFAPDIARGFFFQPRVVAVVHLFTLGWIMLSIFGVLCQFLPVAVGQPLRFLPLAHVSFVAQATGVGVFVVALLAGSRSMLLLGAFLLSIAFVVFAANLAAT